MKKKDIYAVIPAYNEERHIRNVLESVRKHCQNIIVVDDGSSDQTTRIVKRLPVIRISLPINMGKGYALRKGVEYAISSGALGIVTLDADGQHDPRHIPGFIQALDHFDVAIGIRRGHHPIPLIRKLGNRAGAVLISSLYGIYVQDLLCGFRSFRSSVYAQIKWVSDRYGVETEMIARIGTAGIKYTEIKIENIYLDQFKGVSLLEAIEVFLSIPTFKISRRK